MRDNCFDPHSKEDLIRRNMNASEGERERKRREKRVRK